MVDDIFKYRTSNLILYHYMYSELSKTVGVVIWNSMELIRDIWSSLQVNR